MPKNFQQEVLKSQLETAAIMDAGKERVKRRSNKWFIFFSWLPVFGNFVFYREGKKELATKSINNYGKKKSRKK